MNISMAVMSMTVVSAMMVVFGAWFLYWGNSQSVAVRKLQQALFESNQRLSSERREKELFRTLISATSRPSIFVVNPDRGHCFTFVNDAVCKHLELPRESILNMTPHDIDPRYDIDRLEELAIRLERSGTETFETEHKLHDGRTIPVEVTVNRFELDGKPLLAGYFYDISERKALENMRARQEAERARIETEHKYEEVFDNLLDNFFLTDVQPNGEFKMAGYNRAAELSTGLSRQDVIGKRKKDAFPAEIVDAFFEYETLCVETGKPVCFETSLSLRGKLCHFDTTLVPLADSDGKVYRIAGMARDITARKKLEEQIHVREQEFRTLVENSPDVIIRYNLECRRVYANAAFANTVCSSVEDVLGRTPVQEPLLCETSDALYARLKMVLDTGCCTELDVTVKDAQGKMECLQVRLTPEYDAEGKLCSVLLVGRDYTRRKQAEDLLAKRELEFRTLVENSPDTICRHDLLGRRVYINPQIERQAGNFMKDLMYSLPMTYPGGSEGMLYQDKIRETVRSGVITEFELNWTSSTGIERCTLIKLVPEKDHNGDIVSVLAIGRDISMLKSVSRELEKSRTLLQELVAYRERARETERKYIAREIHDELGQQLTALRLEIQGMRIRYENVHPQFKDQISCLNSQLNHTIQFVRNLVSRLRPSVLDMGLHAALEWLADEFTQRSGIVCQFFQYGAPHKLEEEASITIFRVVQESLTNVMKHAQATRTYISVCQESSFLSVQISDNGKGFDISEIRSRSYGLEGVKERINTLGGEFHIYSAPDCGTSLEIDIPFNGDE